MKTRPTHLVALTAIAVLGLLVLPSVWAGQHQEEKGNLGELLKQRRDTLQQLVQVVTEAYRQGTTGYPSVVEATEQLIDAELELADSHNERIALLERQVALMESLSAMVEAANKANQIAQTDSLAAQAAVLDAKIELAREQAKDSKAGK